jgi:hypothetical protein
MKATVIRREDEARLRPSSTPIYCCGQKSVAFWSHITEKWTCGRCGAPVKVAW